MRKHRGSGFTLVELLVVIAIIGILVALLLPAIQAAREAGRRISCGNNIKQLVLGCQEYHDAHNCLPIAYFGSAGWGAANNGKSWMVGVLPFIEQKNLHDKIQWTPFPNPDSNQIGPVSTGPTVNTPIFQTAVKAFLCPSDGDNGRGTMNQRADFDGSIRYGVTNYKGCCGANWSAGNNVGLQIAEDRLPPPYPTSGNGLNQGNGWVVGQNINDPAMYHDLSFFTDGTANTFCIGECVPRWSQWTMWCYINASTATCGNPLNYKTPTILDGTTSLEAQQGDWPNNYSFFSKHPNGGQFGMMDGAVKFVPDQVDFQTYKRLATCAGGRPAALPQN
jgi:prepilin-type N-terminal cleavage/methylation domain-containing protein